MTLRDNLITTDLKAAALGYATKGCFVFPVHHPDNDRRSCRNANGPSRAKHPITPQGLNNVTTDPWAKLKDIQGRVDTLAAITGVGRGYIVAPAWVHISGDRYGRE